MFISPSLPIFKYHSNDDDRTWQLTPKQDHLVFFLGGSLMLGAMHTGSHSTAHFNIPSAGRAHGKWVKRLEDEA